MKRLFVIGNGFDLHHDLPTGMNDFRDYMKINLPSDYDYFCELLERRFPNSFVRDWNHLETMLSQIVDLDDLENLLVDSIESSEKDMDRASYWWDIQYNVRISKDNYHALLNGLDDWIHSIDISHKTPKPDLYFKSDDFFLNFNYTSSLQKIYGIEEKQVLHIHGNADTSKILGHNESYEIFPLLNKTLSPEAIEYGLEEDWRIEEAKEVLNQIPEMFYKDSLSIIGHNKHFFENLSNYDQVVFMGWSLGKQDQIYMDEIMEHITENTEIKVVGYDQKAIHTYEEYFEDHGYPQNRAKYFLWEDVEKVFE